MNTSLNIYDGTWKLTKLQNSWSFIIVEILSGDNYLGRSRTSYCGVEYEVPSVSVLVGVCPMSTKLFIAVKNCFRIIKLLPSIPSHTILCSWNQVEAV